MDASRQQWHHAPSHLFVPGAACMITAATDRKAHLLDTPPKRDIVLACLFEEMAVRDWRVEAWAVLSNHYHLVAHAPENPLSLSSMMQAFHAKSARQVNELDQQKGRRVWFQYWDTCLTHHRSYLARLHYVHHNPVKHGLVRDAEEYPWCSMAWFVQRAEPSLRRTVLSFPVDRVRVLDDF